MNDLKQIFDLDPLLNPLVDKYVAELRAKDKERRDFLDSPRYQEIKAYILSQDTGHGLSQTEIAYSPEEYPFSPKEFSLFCHALFEAHQDKAVAGADAMFSETVLRVEGIRLFLVIGQGSEFIAIKDDPNDTRYLPAPPPHSYDI